jgi:hypothetical protein
MVSFQPINMRRYAELADRKGEKTAHLVISAFLQGFRAVDTGKCPSRPNLFMVNNLCSMSAETLQVGICIECFVLSNARHVTEKILLGKP